MQLLRVPASRVLRFVCLLLGTALSAQTPEFESLTVADGLSQGMIFDLLQDRRGYLWFATKDGLSRYDGYTFKTCQNDPFDPFSLSGNEIRALHEDHLGRLWVGTANNGVDVLEPSTGRFYHLRKLSNQSVVCLAETPDGAMWVGTERGVNRVRLPDTLPTNLANLVAEAKVDVFFWDGGQNERRPPPNATTDLAVDAAGKLWVSTNFQIGWVEPSTGHFEAVWSDLTSLSNDGVRLACTLFPRPDGSIWVGHPDRLLHRYHDGRVEAFPFPERSPFPLVNLVFNTRGDMFVSTRKQIYTLKREAFSKSNAAVSPFKLLHRFPASGLIGSTKMLMDRGGVLWIGTNGYGLRKYNPGERGFLHYMEGQSMRRIACDAQGRIWVWFNKYFSRLDESTGKLSEVLLNEPNMAQHDCLVARDGSLWLLCEDLSGKQGEGFLVKINAQTLSPEARYPLTGNFTILSQMCEDHAGNLLAIGGQGILNRFDTRFGTSSTFDISQVTGVPEVTYSLCVDAQGDCWVSTPHGLVRCHPDARGAFAFTLFKNNPADRNSLNCDAILVTCDDPKQTAHYLWVGTKGGGLNRLDKTTGECRHYTMADGLPNNVVYGIQADATGALWLSTNYGLTQFDPESGDCRNFFAADGLQENEFNTASFARTADGRLFFGGVNGLTVFYPGEIGAETSAAPVLLTGLRVLGKPVVPGEGILDKAIDATQRITLRHFQNQITFEFAAMDFVAPKQNQYRYRLLGSEEDWVEPTLEHRATYANLAPGDYTFEVQTGGSQGIWSGQVARLEIQVLPPWWRTRWAYLLYGIAAIVAVWGFYRFQINKIRLRNELAFGQREAERLAELDRLKSNFFSSVTHEFRTPLTLLLEPLRQMLADSPSDAATRYRLQLMEKSAQSLLAFVNQLLDLSKLEAGQMPLDLRAGMPVEAVRMVAETFRPLAEQQGIELELDLSPMAGDFIFDRGKLEQVVSNLLSNALKFTPKGGKVILEMSEGEVLKTARVSSKRSLIIRVHDTGIGIPPEALPLVFDRFYQVGEGAVQGTGIGLALTKELVERLGGTISVSSTVGEGSTFTVVLPAGRMRRGENSVSDSLSNLAQPVPLPPPATPDASGRARFTVLLIEDHPDLRHLLRVSLSPDYRILEAADGDEGIAKALEHVPDLIVSDLMMPGKNGYEVCEALKNDPRSSHIPIILLTAKAAVEGKIQGLQHGADAYLTKPFRTDELAAHIENLIATRLRLQSIFSQKVSTQTVLQSAQAVLQVQEHEFLQRLTAVVEANLDNENMDAEAYARALLMSRSQLHRKISALTGRPLTEFVRNYRLDRAREMLLRQEGSIAEIGWRTGFPNAKYFSTCFRERFGVAPSNLRAEA